jgi:hypothetical protein
MRWTTRPSVGISLTTSSADHTTGSTDGGTNTEENHHPKGGDWNSNDIEGDGPQTYLASDDFQRKRERIPANDSYDGSYCFLTALLLR